MSDKDKNSSNGRRNKLCGRLKKSVSTGMLNASISFLLVYSFGGSVFNFCINAFPDLHYVVVVLHLNSLRPLMQGLAVSAISHMACNRNQTNSYFLRLNVMGLFVN